MIEKRVTALEKMFSQCRFSSGDGVQIVGTLHLGLAVNIDTGSEAGAAAVGGGGGPPVFGCTDPAANNFNPAATVDDGSCTYNTGCPEVSLACDSISASLSKCGYAAYDGSGPVYLQKDCTQSTDANSACCSTDGTTCNSEHHASASFSFTFDPSTCSGGAGVETSCNLPDNVGCGGETSPSTASCGCAPEDALAIVSATSRSTTNSFTAPAGGSCGPGGLGTCGAVTTTTVSTYDLSNEYTTATLISNTEAALPSFPGTFDGSCSATRNLSEDQSSYSISRFKPKWTFAAATSGFTINYNEHFEPDVGSPSDTPRSIGVSVGQTEITGPEVIEPSENGTTTIAGINVVC